jgi:hypothetical protein
MRRTWAVFTFCDAYPVLVERWESRAAALRSAEHFSFMSGRSYQVVEQVLPDRARVLPNDVATDVDQAQCSRASDSVLFRTKAALAAVAKSDENRERGHAAAHPCQAAAEAGQSGD